MAKAQGIHAARILASKHRAHKYRSAKFKGRKTVKEKPMQGACMASGNVVKKIGVEAKQPNSAVRKCCVVNLIKNGKKIIAFVPKDGSLNYVEENDKVLVCGLGMGNRSVGDLPRVRFQIIKVLKTSLSAIYKGKKQKPKS
ncbi:MAG: 40S ribosomal protein S23 [Paramarteilia canceri]